MYYDNHVGVLRDFLSGLRDMTKKKHQELLKELRRLERICSEQAKIATMDLERDGLLKVAKDCRMAAQAIEARLADPNAICPEKGGIDLADT